MEARKPELSVSTDIVAPIDKSMPNGIYKCREFGKLGFVAISSSIPKSVCSGLSHFVSLQNRKAWVICKTFFCVTIFKSESSVLR